jgi:DNA-binding SARP family transcriptional activator
LNHNYPHNRERLAAIFWGDYSTKISRKYLRNALWRLRQILQSVDFPTDDFLLISDDSVSFTNAQACWIDVINFDSDTSALKDISGRDLTWDQAQKLESATDLYTGDLLESTYEDWCLYDRERLRIAYFNTLEKLVNFHGFRGAHRRGLDFCDRILSRDNTRERIHRQKMWLLWQTGDRNGALAQYKICSQILREELGVKPMRETRQIYHQIQKLREAPSHWYGQEPETDRETLPDEGLPQTIQSLTESALDKLQKLQMLMAETNDEIQRIERLISKVLYSSKHP